MTEAKRGRPRAFDPEVALKQASDAFRAGGYASTSLDDIAKATGLNRPSLYAAFGDKKAMYVAALERLWGNIDQQFAALQAADLPLAESVARILKSSIDAYTAGDPPQGCLAICTATAEASGDPDIRERLDRVLDLMDGRIEGFYARAGQPRAVLDDMAEEALRALT